MSEGDSPGADWFETEVRTRSYEMDAFGHLNHAVHLNYMEVARIRALSDAGHPVQDLLARGWGVHVVRVEIDYRSEAFMDETLVVRTRMEGVRRSSLTVVQEIVRQDHDGPTLISEARVTWVWVDDRGRPTRVPDGIVAALERGSRQAPG